MTEENTTPEVELATEENPEEESLLAALAPIAMIVGATAGGVYLVRKFLKRSEPGNELEVHTEIVETTSTEV